MAEKVYKSRVKESYEKEVVPYLVKKFGYKNVNEVPKLVKIVINSGLGDIKDNAKSVQIAHDELKAISGQKPVITKARKSVANFKVREGMNVGLKVTLRKDRMYDFYDLFLRCFFVVFGYLSNAGCFNRSGPEPEVCLRNNFFHHDGGRTSAGRRDSYRDS